MIYLMELRMMVKMYREKDKGGLYKGNKRNEDKWRIMVKVGKSIIGILYGILGLVVVMKYIGIR